MKWSRYDGYPGGESQVHEDDMMPLKEEERKSGVKNRVKWQMKTAREMSKNSALTDFIFDFPNF